MRLAASYDARLLVVPELFVSGCLTERLADIALDLDGPEVAVLRKAAAEIQLVTVVGLPERAASGVVYNSAVVIDVDGMLAGVHRKVHLAHHEERTFTAGDRFGGIDTAIGRIGVAHCYDIEFPESVRALVLDGVDLLAVPAANVVPFCQMQQLICRTRAWENGVAIALANQSGADSVFEYFGNSTILDSWSTPLAVAAAGEGLITASVEMGAAPSHRLRYLSRRRPDTYVSLIAADRRRSVMTEPSGASGRDLAAPGRDGR